MGISNTLSRGNPKSRIERSHSMRRIACMTAILLAVATSGCAHTQLRWNTTRQARTLTEIYEQQVLDNLAMFVYDPNSLPSFAHPNQGAGDVTDTGNAGSNTNWSRLGFTSEIVNLTATRAMRESWTLTPTHDVRRLELMRCAYQDALFCAGVTSMVSACPDCDKLRRAFYRGSSTADYIDDCDESTLVDYTEATGRTTPACFEAVQWFCWGSKADVPKDCQCLKVGKYCDIYVWVRPGGQNELTKLTMTILDYAYSPSAPRPSISQREREVVRYLDKDGKPVGDRSETALEIRAVLPANEPIPVQLEISEATIAPEALQGLASDKQDELTGTKRKVLIGEGVSGLSPATSLPPILPPPSGFTPLQFELYRSYLTPQP